jgi:hypothetical protein
MPNVIGRANNAGAIYSRWGGPQVPQQVRDVQRAAATNHPEHAGTSVNYINANSHKDVQSHLAPKPQRGVASMSMASANTEMWIVRHSYHSGEPQRGFLANEPPGGKLKLRMTITPSGHDGRQKAEQYAKENTYVARVGYYDNNRFVELDKKQFDGEGIETDKKSVQKNKAHWAASSPEFEVDLKDFRAKHPGKDLVMQGWPSFSAGVFGYVEARETRIKV